MKVLLVLIDGMRPDAIKENRFVEKLVKEGLYTFEAQTVVPPVTLPCHMSLFHSVVPARHGVVTNHYTPPVHNVDGLFEQLNKNKKICGFFYNWEELRDISRPGGVSKSCYLSYFKNGMEKTDRIMTEEAIRYINNESPDFVFLYLGDADEVGHKYGWMSDEYLKSVENALANTEHIMSEISDDYAVIITADHGGHDRMHGMDIPEDMTIPMFISNAPDNAKGKLKNASILDIAPTVASLCGIELSEEWEGKILTDIKK